MTDTNKTSGADVLELLTPSGGIIEPSMWEYFRTFARDNPTVDVSDDVFLMRQSTMVHCYGHTLRVMGDRPRIALLPADDLDEARTAVAALIAERDALAAEVKALREDAERYQWLRENAKPDDLWDDDVVLRFPGPDIDGFDSLDDIVDAARASAATGGA